MPWFVQHRLHEQRISNDFLPLLRRVDRFMQQVESARKQRKSGGQVDTEDLTELHDGIESLALKRAGEGPRIGEEEAIEAFVRGVLRVLHYRDTVLSGLPVVDLAGSSTLEAFQVDVEEGAERQVREALTHAFGLDATALDELEATLDEELDAVAARRSIIEALDLRHPLHGDPDRSCHALFSELFPGHPLLPGEVRLVRTGTSLFLCVPYQGGKLLSVHPRTAEEQVVVDAFVSKLSQFEQPFMANFPVFGCFHANDADPALLDALVETTGLKRSRLIQKLTTMVTVLPTPEIDQYIVHDAWGHQWQALLYDFESRYQDAARYERPPAFNARYGEGVSLLSAARSYASTGNTDVFDRWVQAAFAYRLANTLSGLFAEILADAVEYKFLHENPELWARMPSSSFFKGLPAKLDLTLHDLPLYFEMVHKGFSRLALSKSEHDRLTDALRAEDIQDPDVVAEALRERLASWLDEVHRADLQYDVSDDGVYINVFARVALHFAQLHAALNELYPRLESAGPLRHFGDTLVFSIASFYEADPHKNFWLTDDFVEQWFEPLWKRFLAALD